MMGFDTIRDQASKGLRLQFIRHARKKVRYDVNHQIGFLEPFDQYDQIPPLNIADGNDHLLDAFLPLQLIYIEARSQHRQTRDRCAQQIGVVIAKPDNLEVILTALPQLIQHLLAMFTGANNNGPLPDDPLITKKIENPGNGQNAGKDHKNDTNEKTKPDGQAAVGNVRSLHKENDQDEGRQHLEIAFQQRLHLMNRICNDLILVQPFQLKHDQKDHRKHDDGRDEINRICPHRTIEAGGKNVPEGQGKTGHHQRDVQKGQ